MNTTTLVTSKFYARTGHGISTFLFFAKSKLSAMMRRLLIFMFLGAASSVFAQDITFNVSSVVADANVGFFDFTDLIITNNTAGTLNVSSITITGTDANQFSFNGGNSGNPPYVLLSGEALEFVAVEFSPTSAGTKTATLNVFSDSPDSPHTLSLLGTSEVAIEPELSLTVTNQPSGATVFDLLSINVGEPDTIQAIIKNTGNTTLNISDLQLSGTGASQYEFAPSISTPIVISPFDSIIVDIKASATYPISIPSPGISTIGADLSITHDDPNLTSPSVTQLQFYERAPDPSLSVASLDFGNVPLGNSSSLTVTVTNNFVNTNVNGDLVITGLDFGVNADVLSSSTAFPIRLATNESTDLEITYSPDVFEALNATVTVLANVQKSLTVQGQGTIKQLTPEATTLNFGDVNRDDNNGQASASINLVASGGQPVTITGISFSGPDASSFFNNITLPFEIADNLDWLVFFIPSTAGKGAASATMTITSDAINSPHEVEITSNVIYPPILAGSETFIDIESLDRLTTLDTTFTITNTGTQTLNITSYSFGSVSSGTEISFVDYPASFPISLAENEELPITVRFSPTDGDDLFAEVNIVSNASNGTLQTVSLQADVVFPVAYISNEFDLPLDSVRFGDVSTAENKRDSLLIVNEGTGDLTISAINISGLMAGDFSLPGVVYPVIVASNSSLKLPVQFDPAVGQRRFASLTMESNNVPSELSIGLAGHGISPVLSFSSSITLGRAQVGNTSQYFQEITNWGDVPATIHGFEITGSHADLFTISGLETPVVLEPGVQTGVQITFSPDAVGLKTAQLEMLSNVVNGPLVATLTGSGVDEPIFYVADTLFNVEGLVGEQNTFKIGVTNNGGQDLNLTSAFFAIGSSGVFSAGQNSFGLPITIPPGETDSVEFLFSPIVSGEEEAVLIIATNDQFASNEFPTDRARIYIAGTGLGPKIEYSVDVLDFESTFTDYGKELSLDLTNTGVSDQKMDFVYPDPEAEFTIFYDGYTVPTVPGSFSVVTIAPGETQRVNVFFKPSDVGLVEDSISFVLRNSRNEIYYEKLAVQGTGVEPPRVYIGALKLEGDDFERTGDLKTLLGNVHVGDLDLGEEVVVDLANNTIEGDGNVVVTDVPPNGTLASGNVVLRSGGFKYFVNGADSTLSLNPNSQGSSFFQIIGLELEVSDLVISEKGVRAGGFFALPEFIFGEDAGFRLDSVLISKETGTDVVGKFAIEAPLTVFDIFSLESVVLEFDSFNDCFSGEGSMSSEAGAFELSIDAGIVLKNGGLDGVSLEVEAFPGIPLGQTGFALAGGNGAISGLQVPPVSIELGVDLIPVAPGANKIVRFDNIGFKYTFGTSFAAGGTLLLYGMDIGEAGLEGNSDGVFAEAFINVLEIYKGGVGLSVQTREGKVKVSGHAGLSVQIPELPDAAGLVGTVLNEFLPITLAEVSTSFDETRITGSLVYPPIPARISATIALDDADQPQFTIGLEFTLYNPESTNDRGRMGVKELPYAMYYENDPNKAEKGHLEGESIVINSTVNPQGRALETEMENTEFPFSLDASLEALIVRVEGVGEVPTFSLVLPTGQEVTEENALEMGYFHTTYEQNNQSYLMLANTLPGDYIIKINGTGEFEIDIAGSEFGPSFSFNEINHDTSGENVEINWEDEDASSDAKISFYYDTDQSGGNGQLIALELSEDDETDMYNWDVSSIENGTYYIYGVINNGVGSPMIRYASEPITIARASAIEVPVLETALVVDSTVELVWTSTSNADHYLVYYAEEGTVSARSQVFNAGKKTTFSIPDLSPGHTYQFAVVAVDGAGVRSNLSNALEVSFISETLNNMPIIDASSLPAEIKVGETYQATILATDADTEDVLTYLLTRAPEGMTIDGNMLIWTPGEAQVGKSLVRVKVQDPDLAADSIQFSITVIDEQSSRASLTFNSTRFNGLDKIVQVSLTDTGLDTDPAVRQSQEVSVFSKTDAAGITITLTETSANSGVFTGSFGFNNATSQSGSIGVSVADSVFVSYQDEFPNEEVKRFVLFEQSETPNEFPSAILLTNTNVRDEAKVGDLIGVLTTEDADDNEHAYELVDGVGSDHNHLFAIDGQALAVNSQLRDLEETVLNVRVRSTDSKNGFFEQTFALSLEDVLGNPSEGILLSEVHLYPNPTSRKVFVNIDSERGPIAITILSGDGRRLKSEVFDKRWNGTKISMDISELPQGVYFVQVEQLGQMVTKRLIKD